MTKYAKLINGNLEFSKKIEQFQYTDENNQIIYKTLCSPTPDQLIELGYKEVVDTPPNTPKWYRPVSSYNETDTQIVQEWSYIKLNPPIEKSLIDMKIAEQLDKNDEFSLVNKGIMNPNDEDYLNYRIFVEDCKAWAQAEIAEYESA